MRIGNLECTNRGTTMRALSISSLVVVVLGILAGRRANGDESLKQSRQVIERGLTFLEKDALKWREERGCATCHHGTMTVWALSEAKSQGYQVRADYLADAVQWTKERFAPRSSAPQAPQAGTVSIPLIYLGMMSQNLPILSRDEIHGVAANLTARQYEDGTWESPPPKNGPPPTWESRETIALLALLAWEPYVRDDAKEAAAARAGRDKALAWLSQTKSTETAQALTWRLLLDARRGSAEDQLRVGI